MQCACAILQWRLSPGRLYIFPHYFINGTIFEGGWGGVIERELCILILSATLSKTILILRRIRRDINMNVNWLSCRVPVMLVRFEWNLNILDVFSKSYQISNFMKIRPVGAKLFHSERRKRPMMKLIVAFDNYATMPKNGIFIYIIYRLLSVSKWLNKIESKYSSLTNKCTFLFKKKTH
jgi:hypothetical protein